MRSEKEILDALSVLQEVCECNICSECFLRNGDDGCGVFEDTNGNYFSSPSEWHLKTNDKPRLILN